MYYDNEPQECDFHEPNIHQENPEPSTSRQFQANNESTADSNVENTANFLEWKTSW